MSNHPLQSSFRGSEAIKKSSGITDTARVETSLRDKKGNGAPIAQPHTRWLHIALPAVNTLTLWYVFLTFTESAGSKNEQARCKIQ